MDQAQQPEAAAYPGGVPPTWRVEVRRTQAEGGRWLVYYDFTPSPDVSEVDLGQ